MRVEKWHPEIITAEVEKKAMDRLETAAGYVMGMARQLVPIGQSRPPYKSGKAWTARQAGLLRDSIRVTRLKGDPKLNIRVYAGWRQSDKLTAYYARWVELGSIHNATPKKPYLRPALHQCKSRILSIVENGNG